MLTRIDPCRLAQILSKRYAINLTALAKSDSVVIRPSDLPIGQGFVLRISIGWRTITVEFCPESFSGPLLKAMELSDSTKRNLFKAIALSCNSRDIQLSVEINQITVSPFHPEDWPTHWRKFSMQLKKSPIVPEEFTAAGMDEYLTLISGYLLGMILSLLPIDDEPLNVEGLPEGSRSLIELNRYERSAINRQICIMHHGYLCNACGFNFEKTYGLIGREFIHVHHVIPVSSLGPNYSIDPVNDLVPVCPNCHAMLHRRNPPYSVAELRQIMSAYRES